MLVPSKDKDEHTYVMVDACMLFTREEKWKENKLARVFHESQNIDIQVNRKETVDTVYVSHLGSVDDFLPKVERHLSMITNPKIFVADGAKWIWRWVEDTYPGAIHILDYYHAVEKIEDLAKHQYGDEQKRKLWLDQQKDLLLDDEILKEIVQYQKYKIQESASKKG